MSKLTSQLTKNQRRVWYRRLSDQDSIKVTIRFDDRCDNGHNTFTITAEYRINGRMISCGCLHSIIARYFPEFIHLIKWHLCSTDGPLHYIANTIFLAGERDCHGCLKGEQKTNKNGKPMWLFKGPKNTVRFGEKPTAVGEWVPILGEGKERELDAARKAAIWPDASDEMFTVDSTLLTLTLKQRLPKLLRNFQQDIVALGLEW